MQIIFSDRMLIVCVSFFLFQNLHLMWSIVFCLFVCLFVFFNSVEKLRGIKLVFVVQVFLTSNKIDVRKDNIFFL